MLPVTVAGGQLQDATPNCTTSDPPVKLTVSVKLIVVPHKKLGAVLTEKGTVLVPPAPGAMFG